MTTPVCFSIIIPLHNKQAYIKQTIESVLKQTVENFEVLVIDDGSTDNSANVVASIADPRVRLIKQTNKGVSAARNNGIRRATGKYVCFLDADDTWSNNFLEVVRNLFAEFPNAGLVCPSYQVDYGNRIFHPQWRGVDSRENGLVTDFYEMATAPFWICNSSCIAIKRDVLLNMDYWFPENETVYEDFDLWIRLGTQYPVAHSNTICSTYRRITEKNARTAHTKKVVYSATYMNTLNSLIKSKDLSTKQKMCVHEIIDRRMVPYIFSLLMSNRRNVAKEILKTWHPTKHYKIYRILLNCAVYMPNSIVNTVQSIRYKLF